MKTLHNTNRDDNYEINLFYVGIKAEMSGLDLNYMLWKYFIKLASLTE